jgi:hypothetical protein
VSRLLLLVVVVVVRGSESESERQDSLHLWPKRADKKDANPLERPNRGFIKLSPGTAWRSDLWVKKCSERFAVPKISYPRTHT